MPLTRNFPRRVNALGGKRPQATGIVLIPKNNGNVLKTSNGSTANYGGNTKFGLYPNVGMSYLFQNKIGVGSLFYNTTTPSQVNPPRVSNDIPTGSTVTFTFDQTDTYGLQIVGLYDQDSAGNVWEDAVGTTGLIRLHDGITNNREFFKSSVLDAPKYVNTVAHPLVESVIPLVMSFEQDDADDEPQIYCFILDDDTTANYTLTWTQAITGGSSNPFGGIPIPFTYRDLTTDPEAVAEGLRKPPIGLAGLREVTVPMTDITYQPGTGGYNAGGDQEQLPVNFYESGYPPFPLVITITKN